MIICWDRIMSTDLLTQFKALHLYGMAEAWSELRAESPQRKQALSPEIALSQLIKAEIADRQMRSLKYQLKIAKFPIHRDLVEFDWNETPLAQEQVKLIWPQLLESRLFILENG